MAGCDTKTLLEDPFGGGIIDEEKLSLILRRNYARGDEVVLHSPQPIAKKQPSDTGTNKRLARTPIKGKHAQLLTFHHLQMSM